LYRRFPLTQGLQWGLRLARDTSVPHPRVRMATMAIIPMHAHRTAITAPVGSLAVFSSALARGITDTIDRASMDRAFTGVDGMAAAGMVHAFTDDLAMATMPVVGMLIAAALADSGVRVVLPAGRITSQVPVDPVLTLACFSRPMSAVKARPA
jgi:hypothetical protein